MRPLTFLTILLALLATSCSGSDHATPRRKAWPRIHVADSTYHAVPGMALNIEINDAAVAIPDTTRRGDGKWLNIGYPIYGDAVVFLTVSPAATPDQLASVIDNRLERMALNSGGAPSELTEMSTPDGFDGQVVVTRTGTVTPVQMLAAGKGYVVTAALYLPAMANSAADSIAPILDAVRGDMLHLVKNLK